MKTIIPWLNTFSEPRFSVEAFFYFLLSMMVLSFVAFVLLNVLPSMKVEHSSNDKSALINAGKKSQSELVLYFISDD